VISRVGVPQYEEAPIGFGSLFGKNARLAGGPAPVRAYLEPAITQVLSGEIDPGRVFDRTVALDDVAAGYAAMDAREALKVMVRP
jgi:threonine dehydrogenase-like Zn-dependent dehydrogenase